MIKSLNYIGAELWGLLIARGRFFYFFCFCFLFSSFLNLFIYLFFYLQFSSQQNTTTFWVKIKHQHLSKILFFLYNFPPTTKMVFLSSVQKNSWNGNCLSAGHTRNSFVEWRLFTPAGAVCLTPSHFNTFPFLFHLVANSRAVI